MKPGSNIEHVMLTDGVDPNMPLAERTARRIFLGTARVHYLEKDHYRVRILCCRVCPYWILGVYGVLHLFPLLIPILCPQVFSTLLEHNTVKANIAMIFAYGLALSFFVSLLLGLHLQRPALLLPFRILYGFLRSAWILGFAALGCFSAILVVSGEGIHIVELLLIPILSYIVLGVLASAATKCVAHMRALQDITALYAA